MTKPADKPQSNKELESEIERLNRLLEEERNQHQEAKETLEAIRTGAVDGIVRSSPEGEQVFILKGSDQPYRSLIEEMNEGALLISESGTILYANIGFAELVDAQLDKVMGTHVSDWVSARNVEVLNDIISANRKNGRRVFEIPFQTTKQKQIPTQVSLNKILFGTINASALVVTDLTKHMEGEVKLYTSNLEKEITQRKKAEEALRQSQELISKQLEEIKSYYNNAPVGLAILDKDLRYIRVNNSLAEMNGLPAEEHIGKTVREVVPTIAEQTEELPRKIIKSGEAVRNIEFIGETAACPGEKRTWLESWIPIKDSLGKVTALYVMAEDITQRKKAEEALKESEQLYHSVFDNSQDGFQLIELVYDKNGKPIDHKFLKVNHAYESIIGVKADGILDKTARFISPNVEPHWLDIPDRVAKTGISEHVELYNKDIGKWLDCFYFLYSKNVIGTIFRDITGRKKLEKQLQDSERLAAIGTTAGMVGHDIRNPLQAITGDVYIAKSDLASMADCEGKQSILESLTEVEKNIDYINKIVADLQDFARPLKPNPEETDLKSIIQDLLKKNGLPENIEVSVRIETEKIVADSTFINRILYNLVNNAVQAMSKGGKLTIRTYKEGNDTLISVKDTGVGIPEAVKGKLFTPMFTTKSKGQGFGLAVIKRMTESLGGTVSFESQEGKGTKFTVRLPPPKS